MKDPVYYRLYFGRREGIDKPAGRDELFVENISWYEYPIVYIDDRKPLENLAIFLLTTMPSTIGVRIEESKT